MNLHAEGSLVEDYEHLIPTLSLPDQNDRHVLAAAIEARASVLVTFNLSDFPKQTLAAYDIAPQHPDAFLCDLFDENLEAFVGALQEMVSQLKNPTRTLEQHLEVLSDQGLKMVRIFGLSLPRLMAMRRLALRTTVSKPRPRRRSNRAG